MKICVVAPVILDGPPQDSVKEFARAARPDCTSEVVFLEHGPTSIESEYEETIAAPDSVMNSYQASIHGADAVVISCMLDPGVHQARELLTIPVLGPAEVSMHVAAMLGEKFSIVTVLNRLIAPLTKRARIYGLSNQLASVRAINVPVLDLECGNGVVEAIINESILAIEEDNANAIVFGCTGMAGMAIDVHKGLQMRGYNVPVIDPGLTALKVAESLVDLKLSHSKLTYPFPPKDSGQFYSPYDTSTTDSGEVGSQITWEQESKFTTTVITPIIGDDSLEDAISCIKAAARPDNQIEMLKLDHGPTSIESRFEELLASPNILFKAQAAQKRGSKAVIINCMGDPGLDATRELLDVLVLGAANTALHIASILASRFSIIVPLQRNISMMNELVRSYGIEESIASIRAVDLPVLELETQMTNTVRSLSKVIERAILEDGAEAIVLGCTGMAGVLELLNSTLKESGLDVPVLDPGVVTLKIAEVLVDLGLVHSKRRYPSPPTKLIRGY